MKPSEYAVFTEELLTKRRENWGAISVEQEDDLRLARAYRRLREAAFKIRPYIDVQSNEEDLEVIEFEKLLEEMEETDD